MHERKGYQFPRAFFRFKGIRVSVQSGKQVIVDDAILGHELIEAFVHAWVETCYIPRSKGCQKSNNPLPCAKPKKRQPNQPDISIHTHKLAPNIPLATTNSPTHPNSNLEPTSTMIIPVRCFSCGKASKTTPQPPILKSRPLISTQNRSSETSGPNT